jgi:hypothetical protein
MHGLGDGQPFQERRGTGREGGLVGHGRRLAHALAADISVLTGAAV